MPNTLCFCVYVNAGTDMKEMGKKKSWKINNTSTGVEKRTKAEAAEGFLDYGSDLCSIFKLILEESF